MKKLFQLKKMWIQFNYKVFQLNYKVIQLN